MHKHILNLLICPNTYQDSLEIFAHKLERKNKILTNVIQSEMLESDDIINGVILNKKSNCAYPIYNYVASLLSDTDTDKRHYIELLQLLRNNCPSSFFTAIDFTINRLKKANFSDIGIWNKEEMGYFDKDVQSEELRKEFLIKIRKIPLWNLYISRSKNLTQRINLKNMINEYILEVGCGNARTISWIFHPKHYHYYYVGSDISFKRLLLAKSVIPEGDFIQCSAFNLPLKDESFAAILGFGIFHHLPNPIDGILNCAMKIKLEGYLALHEPIEKPKLLPDESFIKSLLKEYEHSKHDNEINVEKITFTLNKMNFNIVNMKYENSLFRNLALRLLKNIPKLYVKKWIIEIIIIIDGVILNTVCRLSKHFGPSALLLVAKKSKN